MLRRHCYVGLKVFSLQLTLGPTLKSGAVTPQVFVDREGKVMMVSRLQELQDIAARLLAAARKLPPGQDRQNALEEISKYRLQIAALTNSLSGKNLDKEKDL